MENMKIFMGNWKISLQSSQCSIYAFKQKKLNFLEKAQCCYLLNSIQWIKRLEELDVLKLD